MSLDYATKDLPTTPGADGVGRWAFTVADLERMIRLGLVDERVELIDGEIIPKVTKGDPHEVLKAELHRWLVTALTRDVIVSSEPTLELSQRNAVEPDFVLYNRGLLPRSVRGPDVLLAVEISDTTLSKDLKKKAGVYAVHGIRHYWVCDVNSRRVHQHSEPEGGRYARVEVTSYDQPLTLPFGEGLRLRLSDLD